MATTVERDTVFRYQELPAISFSADTSQPVLTAGNKVLKGSIADISAGKVIAAVGTPAAGSAVLGIAQETYDASASGVDVHLPMVFRRGQCFVDNDTVNPVTAALCGLSVFIKDNITVTALTPGAGALTVRCVGLSPDASQVEIYIP